MALSLQGVLTRPTVVKGVRQTANHKYTCSVDTINHRMIVHSYQWKEAMTFLNELVFTCRQYNLGKLIVQAREADWQRFLRLGFQMEGTIASFFNGQPVYFMSKFFTEERQTSQAWMEEETVLEKVLLSKPKEARALPSHLTLEVAGKRHIPGMVELFDKVFETYPSPLADPEYLAKSMQNDIFVIVRDGKKIVSSAGAEIDRTAKNAEMTNCATLPEARRFGLMNHIFVRLEEELKQQNIGSLFSIARAKSVGMNRVLKLHGYQYRGRLVNNCDICGGFEDMNLWAKEL